MKFNKTYFFIFLYMLAIFLAGSSVTAQMGIRAVSTVNKSSDESRGKIFTKKQVNTLFIGEVVSVQNDCVYINLKKFYDIQPNKTLLLIINEKNEVLTAVRVEIYNPSAKSSHIFARILSPQAIPEIKKGLCVIDEKAPALQKTLSTAIDNAKPTTSSKELAPAKTDGSKGITSGMSIIVSNPEVPKAQKHKEEKKASPVKQVDVPKELVLPQRTESLKIIKSSVKEKAITSEESEEKDVHYLSALKNSEDSFNKREDVAMRKEMETKKSIPLKTAYSSGSGLKAGYSDDNKQFNYFVDYLNKFQTVEHYPINIEERIILKVKDLGGNSIPNAEVNIFSNNNLITNGLTYSDGSFMFFPSEHISNSRQYNAVIKYTQTKNEITIERDGKREIDVRLDYQKNVKENIPIDILFIFDVTGSMQEEIDRLKSSIELIKLNIASISLKPEVRFGMVLYRDKKDEFVTKIIPLTKDLNAFQEELNKVKTAGGGDGPEDLQSALKDSIQHIDWNKDGIRLSFVITDAPPHLDYGQKYTYVSAAKDAKDKGIKIFSIGTGGLDPMGEYILRQLSQYTSAKYIFLTYGEKGESEGGMPGSVSHHTGSNYETDKLEAIIIKIAKEELSNFTDQPVDEGEDYFIAGKIESEKKEETLRKLFDMAVSQLIDYSTYAIEDKTPAAVLSISAKEPAQNTNAEYFTEQLMLSLAKNNKFKMVERKDLQNAAKELELSLAGFIDEKNAVKVGQFIGAKMLMYGDMYIKDDNFELFLKLMRVETGEILSVTKLKINFSLGLLCKPD